MKFHVLRVLVLLIGFSVTGYSQVEKEKVTGQSPVQPTTTQENSERASKAPDSKATVYIYRYKQYLGSALEPGIYCDEAELFNMDNGRFATIMLEPGKHVFRSNDKQSGIELDLKSGEEYYVRTEIATGFWKGHGRLVLTPKEQGAYEIKKLKPLGADKIKDSSKVIKDVAK